MEDTLIAHADATRRIVNGARDDILNAVRYDIRKYFEKIGINLEDSTLEKMLEPLHTTYMKF